MRRALKMFAAIPAAVLPLLPSATCPACVAAYAGVLSSLGLGVLARESVLQPLILGFLAVSVLTIAWSTRRHRRPGPVLIAVAGCLAVVGGRILWDLPAALYFGVACVFVGSIWNLIAKRTAAGSETAAKADTPACCACSSATRPD